MFEKRKKIFEKIIRENIQVKISDLKEKLNIFEDFFIFTKSLNIPVNGLMCIPPANENASDHFLFLKELANKFKIKNLSMGMSSDYVEAIRFGATHLRIGTSFFGERN